MGLIKDVILNRIKAYNSAALAEFIVGPFEEFFARKLEEIATSKLPVKINWFDHRPLAIDHLGEAKYQVRSATCDTSYICDVDEWICQCYRGNFGLNCKHLQAVCVQFGIDAPIDRLIEQTPDVKQRLFQIARGTVVTREFFLGLTERCESGQFVSFSQKITAPTPMPTFPSLPDVNSTSPENELSFQEENVEDDTEVMRAEAVDLFDKATSAVRQLLVSSTDTALLKFTIRFSRQMLAAARGLSQLKNWLANSFFRPNLRKKQIGILPGGQRRRTVLLSGSGRAQQRGRPSTGLVRLQEQRGPKRKDRVGWRSTEN